MRADITAEKHQQIMKSVEIQLRSIFSQPQVKQCLSTPDLMSILCKILEGRELSAT